MNLKIILVLLVALTVIPVNAEQKFSNPSLVLQSVNVPANDFNKIKNNITVIPFSKSHSGSWQITIENKWR